MVPMLAQLSPQQLGLIVAGVFVFVSLFVYGLKDVLRMSFGRAWAISGVVFRESIRKRILWLAPVAMLVVVGLSQFIVKSVDEADSIRQTIQFVLFASGFLVTIASVVLLLDHLGMTDEARRIETAIDADMADRARAAAAGNPLRRSTSEVGDAIVSLLTK